VRAASPELPDRLFETPDARLQVGNGVFERTHASIDLDVTLRMLIVGKLIVCLASTAMDVSCWRFVDAL
jgi:hypothetical protein